jgi:hypothetical protein
MLQMIYGFCVSRALCVAAELGIPDLLNGGAMSSEELARATETHAPSLFRLLRALESVGVFAKDDQERFALTPLGTVLRSDVPGSLRSFAIEVLGRNHYSAWGTLLHSIKTGEIAFNHVYGVGRWQYNAEHPEEAESFDQAMASATSAVAAAILDAYDFYSCGTIVDVGGGDGSLLAAILKAYPQLRGVVADLPHAVAGAQRRLQTEGLMERCDVVPCDFFAAVPKGDTYLLKWIIHDWDDQRSKMILKNCCAAMANGERVLVMEAVFRPGAATVFTKFLDLAMLVMTGGRERSEAEYRALLASANLRLTRVIPTKSELSVIEAVRA